MRRRIFDLDENDNLDEILNLDIPAFITKNQYDINVANTVQTNSAERVQTNEESNGSTTHQFNKINLDNLSKIQNNSDSALGTESQQTSMETLPLSNLSYHSLIRRHLLEDVNQFNASSLTQRNRSSFILSTQEEPNFSAFFAASRSNVLMDSQNSFFGEPTTKTSNRNPKLIQEEPTFPVFFEASQSNVLMDSPISIFGEPNTLTRQKNTNQFILSTPEEPSEFFDKPLKNVLNDSQSISFSQMNRSPTLDSSAYHQSNISRIITEENSLHQNVHSNFQIPNEQTQISLFSDYKPFQPMSSQYENIFDHVKQGPDAYQSPLSQNLFGSYQPPPHIAETVSSIPQSIIHLYTNIKGSGLSDWSFVYAFSAQTCQEFMPMNCNVMLKTTLLLSIASINSNDCQPPIPIVAIGKDSLSANSIMNHIGNFGQRFLAPTDHHFNVAMNNEKFVEIGPVFLAKNGVCYLGNWAGFTKSFSDEIKMKVLELKSAIWTYWITTKNINKEYITFIKYFGVPIVMDSEEPETLAEFILEEAINGKMDIPKDDLNFRYDEIKTYLNVIRKIKVTTSTEAQKLLNLYYNAIKMDREDALSPRGFQVIQQMAESYAKMCLRDTVLVCDVIAIISIFERSVYTIFGFGVSPAPLPENVKVFSEVDEYMMKFEKWVYDYVAMFNQNM